MTWFPFQYRDIQAFHKDNLPLSTSSNEAAKLFDSAITQLAFHDVDPVDGNLEQTMSKMLQADPKFVIGQTMKFAMQLLGDSPRMKPKLLYDVNQFVNGVVQDKTNVWEKMHLKALKSLLDEDLMSASRIYDEILFDHPQDNLALSLIYFMGLYTGQKTLMRNVPARVLKEYFPHDRFYGLPISLDYIIDSKIYVRKGKPLDTTGHLYIF